MKTATRVSRSRRGRSRAGLAAARAGTPLLALLALLAPWALPVGAAAAQVGADSRGGRMLVTPASGHNVSAALVQDARRLLVDRLAATHAWTVIDMERPPTAEPLTATQAASLAAVVHAEIVLSLHISHADTVTLLQVRALTPDGMPRYVVNQSTSGGPEMLPALIETLTTQILNGGQPQTSPRPEPAAPSPRTWSLGFRAKMFMPINTPGPVPAQLPVGGVVFAIDSSDLLGTIDLEFGSADTADAHANLTTFGGGLYRPFGDARAGAFAGLGLRYASVRLGGQGTSGFVALPGVGYRVRFAGAHAWVELDWWLPTFPEKSEDRLIPGAVVGHYSHGPMIGLGITL